MASKWDDEFDFQSEVDKKKSKTDNTKKNRNPTNYNEDYQDLDDTKKVKLPTIAKPTIGNTQKSNKSSSNINLVEINKKKEQAGTKSKIKNYQEDEQYELQQSVAPNPSQFKQKNQKIAPKETIQVQEKEAENSYGNQEFEEENYEQDFEATQVKQQSPVPFKPKEDSKRQSKAPVALPKPPQKQKRAAQSTAKRNQIVAKGNSRTSVRSQSASRTSKSQNKPQQKKEDAPNKYVSLAQKNCQNYQRAALQQLSLDKIVRQNDKIRNMIKKFNDELNDLINKNIMQLKSKKEEKVVNIDEVLKQLEEQKSSNQIAYQNTVKDLQRLKGKEGQLKQEEYQLTIDQKITDAKTSMAELSKAIVKLKQQVNNEGNKLSKIDKQKDGTSNSQQINTIKNNIVLVKKQQEKNDQILSKLYIKVQQLTKKMSDTDNKLNSQLYQAKQKGISIQLNSEITKKFDQNKKKIETSKQHRSKTEALFKTKCEMINHECDQIKASMKLIDHSLASSTANCEEIKIQIKKILEKAKKNTKMPEDLIKNLETMISDLQNGLADQATFTHPKGAKKYQSQKNVEKINALSVTAQRNTEKPQKQKSQQDTVSVKPAIFKKKQKQEQKQDERVWKDDKNTQVKKTERISQSIPQLARFEQKEENQKKQQDRKKPFMIKRNKQTIKTPELDNGAESVRTQAKQEKIQIKKEVEKDDQRPSIAPRMMKFKKNKNEEGTKQQEERKNYETIEKPQQKIVIQQKLQEKTEVTQSDPEKPILAPKRFNLKIKDKKTEDQGYVATSVKKQQPPKVIEQFKPKGLTVDNQPLYSQQKIQPAKQAQQAKLTVQEDEKPKFNLRLRDRQRESNKPQQVQIPQPQSTKQQQQKISISLTDKNENISKQNNNPYSNPYANVQVPKREKQGPLKKQKPVQANAKQNFNIYDQAQDLTNVKEVKIGGESPKPPVKAALAAQPSLQQLLGIKKSKNQVDPDLILDNKITEGRKKEVKSKKDTNFFGDLQL